VYLKLVAAPFFAAGLLAQPAAAGPLTEKELTDLRSRVVIVARREPMKFELGTAGRGLGTLPLALLGPVGSMANIGISSARVAHGGKELLHRYEIADPADFISRQLAERLRGPAGLGDVRWLEAEQPGDWSRPESFRPITPRGMAIVDVRTGHWGIHAFLSDWNRYRVYYEARARVYDPWRSREYAIAKAYYLDDYEKAEDAPTLEELLADDAAMLKSKLRFASIQVAESLRSELLADGAAEGSAMKEMRHFASRYTAAWCSQDPASVASFFSPQGSLKINDGAPHVGREAITEAARGFMRDFPDLVVSMDRLERNGERWIYRWTLTGTNTGPGGTGNPVKISGYEDWKIGPDELVAESLGHFDPQDYARQLAGNRP